MGLSPDWPSWCRESGSIPLLAAGMLLLNQTTQTHLSGSVQQQTREIAAALYTLHLIPHIMYLIAHLNGLLLELQYVILLTK